MVKFILFFLDLFKGLFRAMDVDYLQLRTILALKLTMDNRRGLSTSIKQKKANNQLLWQAVVYAFLGLLIGMITLGLNSPLVSYTIFFGFIMIMIAMMMISEFTNVLIDTRDNHILLPRPVSARTLAMSKIIHIAIYLMHLSLSLSLFTIIFTLVKYGIVATLLLLLLILLATLFTLFLTNIFYLGLMHLVNGEKLKDVLVYFQVAIAILFMGGYQLMPRMIEQIDLANFQMNIHWWTYLIPPVWMSGSMECLINHLFNTTYLPFLLLSLTIPLISLWFVIKALAPKFNHRLSQLDTAGSKPEKRNIRKGKNSNRMDRLASLFSQTQGEATAFKMTWLLSGRERKYKQTVFPAYGYILIFIAVFALKSDKGFVSYEALQQSSVYLACIYMTLLLAFTVTQQLYYSDTPKSSWFYRAMPLSHPGEIMVGAIKSVLVKYFLPGYLAMCIPILYIWGLNVLDDLIYGLLTIALITLQLTSSTLRQLPFSMERETQDMSGNFFKTMLIMISGGIVGAIHWGLTYVNYGVIFAIPLLAVLLHFSLRNYRRLGWEKIDN